VSLNSLLTPESLREHRARWFVYAGGYGQPLEKIPHTASMRGHWPGYDVECSCGWESKTGGAVKRYVADKLWDHRYSEQCAKDNEVECWATRPGQREVHDLQQCSHYVA
jgi:hypothetical protein